MLTINTNLKPTQLYVFSRLLNGLAVVVHTQTVLYYTLKMLRVCLVCL